MAAELGRDGFEDSEELGSPRVYDEDQLNDIDASDASVLQQDSDGPTAGAIWARMCCLLPGPFFRVHFFAQYLFIFFS